MSEPAASLRPITPEERAAYTCGHCGGDWSDVLLLTSAEFERLVRDEPDFLRLPEHCPSCATPLMTDDEHLF